MISKEFLITYGYSSDWTTILYTDIVTAENKKEAVMHLFEQKGPGVYITYIAEL